MSKTHHPPAGKQPPAPRSRQPEAPQDLEEAAPLTPSAHLLNPLHQRFCTEYLRDLNATQAYMRTYGEGNPDLKISTAGQQGYQLLKNPQIRAEIQRLMDERAVVTGITADRVLTTLWAMVTTPSNELTEVRIGACRHCWGYQHQYHYRESELEKAEADFIHKEARRRKEWLKKSPAFREENPFEERTFHAGGGTGFDPKREPHPECPHCHGDGDKQVVIKDTRNLSVGAEMLFGGIKQTEHGMQVLLHDRMPALKLVGEHLGMWSDKFEGPKDVENPLERLLREIHGLHGAGSALPIVHDDPEARKPPAAADVEDVVAKPASENQVLTQTPRKRTTWRPA